MIVVVILMFGIGSPAHAIPISLDFTFSDFSSFAGFEPPADPVSGAIVYEAAAVGAPIESLTSISMMIGSHSYTVDELSFLTSSPGTSSSDIIGGSLNGANAITRALGTNDFWIQYDRCARPGQGANFRYGSTNDDGIWSIWSSTNVTDFSLTGPGPVACGEAPPMAVAEPGTAGLLLLGLAGVLAARRRRAE